MSIDNRILRITFDHDKIRYVKPDSLQQEGPLNSDGIQLELRVSSIFHKALNKTRVEGIFKKDDFEILGNILFRILCLEHQPDANSFVYNELSFVLREKSTRGTVILEFMDKVAYLAELPWEYLQIEANSAKGISPFYMGARKDSKFDLIRFVRYGELDQEGVRDYSPEDNQTLSVLGFVSSPIGEDVRKVDKESLEQCFSKLEKEFNKNGDNRLEWHLLEQPNNTTFYDELEKASEKINGPYILHFYGHARMEPNGPEIAFVDQQTGKAQWVSSELFKNYFDAALPYRRPEAVVFQACESGQVNTSGEGFGVSLIGEGIPFVVAMQNEVTPDTSTAFCEVFYRSLLSGQNIFRAVTTGRSYLGCTFGKKNPVVDHNDHYNNNSFGTPVIFSSTTKPIRFLPPLEVEREKSVDMKLICPVCETEYPYGSGLERCRRPRCNGQLELIKSTPMSVESRSLRMQERRFDAKNN